MQKILIASALAGATLTLAACGSGAETTDTTDGAVEGGDDYVTSNEEPVAPDATAPDAAGVPADNAETPEPAGEVPDGAAN